MTVPCDAAKPHRPAGDSARPVPEASGNPAHVLARLGGSWTWYLPRWSPVTWSWSGQRQPCMSWPRPRRPVPAADRCVPVGGRLCAHGIRAAAGAVAARAGRGAVCATAADHRRTLADRRHGPAVVRHPHALRGPRHREPAVHRPPHGDGGTRRRAETVVLALPTESARTLPRLLGRWLILPGLAEAVVAPGRRSALRRARPGDRRAPTARA